MNIGYTLYEGISYLDYLTPVVCIMTMHSDNTATGNMVQTWILRQDMPPVDAVKEDKDEAICGECIHRTLRTCYVLVWQGPRSVWKTWKEGGYASVTQKILKRRLVGRSLRIGAYGDPAAIPTEVWDEVVPHAKEITGYTHHWHKRPHLARYCMASVESAEERLEAKKLGFRTFRVLKKTEERIRSEEAQCPKSEEAGKILTCLECGYCNGNLTGLSGDVAIYVHGKQKKRYEVAKQQV